MNRLFLVLLLYGSVARAQDVPYYQRSVDKDQDVGSINTDFRNLADKSKDNLGGSDVPGVTCLDNPTFCVDGNNHRVGIQTSSPTVSLQVNSTALFKASVTVEGLLGIGWERVSTSGSSIITKDTSCSAGKVVLGCGCVLAVNALFAVQAISDTTCRCAATGSDDITTTAICARVGP